MTLSQNKINMNIADIKNKIKQNLYNKGIDKNIIETAIDDIPDSKKDFII